MADPTGSSFIYCSTENQKIFLSLSKNEKLEMIAVLSRWIIATFFRCLASRRTPVPRSLVSHQRPFRIAIAKKKLQLDASH
jgi:hypothetical protein